MPAYTAAGTAPTLSQSTVLTPPGGGRFAAVIFDMGGTLLEFENVPWDVLYPASVRSLYDWLSRERKALPGYDEFLARFVVLLDRRRQRVREQMLEYRIGPLLRELLEGFKISVDQRGIDPVINAYYAAIRRQVTAFPESLAAVRQMKALGYRVGLLSNTCFRERDHKQELVSHGLWDSFDVTYFTSAGRYRKPHPEPFRVVAARLGVPTELCLYIGDRQFEDVLGPQKTGMSACLVRRPGKKYQDGLTSSCEIDSLAELGARLGHNQTIED